MGQFLEYLNAKGKMQDVKTKTVADDVEGETNKTGKGTKPKTSTKGFADQGDKDLIIDPCKNTKPAKIRTAEAIQYINIIKDMIQSDPMVMETLVREFKRNDLLGHLVGELTLHNETYSHLAEVLANENYGPTIAKKLARAIREDVAPPMHQMDDQDDDQPANPDDETNPNDEENLDDDENGEEVPPQEGDEENLDDTPPEEGDQQQPPQQGMNPAMMGGPQRKPMPPAMEHLLSALKMFVN
jgi:hypothetical protein